MSSPLPMIYCSWSKYKMEEWNEVISEEIKPGVKFSDIIRFEFRKVDTKEPLLRDLEAMVKEKAISAYQSVRRPCIVEHAGLILDGYDKVQYPGGLTQPMWDALGAENFSATCMAVSARATARAVIGYCDGASVQTFKGDTVVSLSRTKRGAREYYWDTIFCPDELGGKTYAEAADVSLASKLKVSQSIRALRSFLEYAHGTPSMLFPVL